MDIEKPITIDLLETTGSPAHSTTSDMPVITPAATMADAMGKDTPDNKPADTPKADDTAAPVEGKTVEDESADDLEQPESTSASDEPKKPAKGVQKRLDELTKQREEANRRAESADAERLRLLALLEQKNAPKQEIQTAEEAPVKPDRSSYDTDEAFDDARIAYAGEYAAYKVRTEFAAQQKADQDARQQASIAEQQNKVREAYVARVGKFREAHPDYSEVAESPNVRVSIPMAHAIAHSEHGPEIAYYLGSNPDEAKRIASLAPPSQLMELGLIVGKLNAPAPKPVSAAKPPITPIKPSGSAPTVPDDELSMEQYAAKRRKEMAGNGRGMRH